jgi:hypothetical protein
MGVLGKMFNIMWVRVSDKEEKNRGAKRTSGGLLRGN